jgi:hypothetical protein
MSYFRTFLVCLALALAACTTTNGVTTFTDPITSLVNKLATMAVPDLQAAAADATAHGDVVANQCYIGLIPVVQQIQSQVSTALPLTSTVAAPIGLATKFQDVRDAKAAVNALPAALLNPSQLAGLRVQINLACGALVVDTQASIADPLGLISGIALP